MFKMTGRERLLAKNLKEYNLRWYGESKGSLKDYIIVYRDFCRGDGDYSETFKTKLYNHRGGEYCGLLEILAAHYRDHQAKTA